MPNHLASNVKEPTIQKSQPLRPFQEVAVGLCSYAGQHYLNTVDCHTDWPDIIPMIHNTTAPQITTALQQSFCRTTIPDILWSDGGPQFTLHHFALFARQWGSFTRPRPHITPKVMEKWRNWFMLPGMVALWPWRILLCSTPIQKYSFSQGSSSKAVWASCLKLYILTNRCAFSQEWQLAWLGLLSSRQKLHSNLQQHKCTTNMLIHFWHWIQREYPKHSHKAMVSLQLYNLSEDITSKLPVAECSFATVTDVFYSPYQHI